MKIKNGSFIYGSNFSLELISFELNEYLAKMMANLKKYNVSMEEIHHTQKLDAPSGTAITLAEGIIKHTDYANWTLETPISNEIHIEAKRIENVPGTHSIFYDSEWWIKSKSKTYGTQQRRFCFRSCSCS